jgi:hypothetical protein
MGFGRDKCLLVGMCYFVVMLVKFNEITFRTAARCCSLTVTGYQEILLATTLPFSINISKAWKLSWRPSAVVQILIQPDALAPFLLSLCTPVFGLLFNIFLNKFYNSEITNPKKF